MLANANVQDLIGVDLHVRARTNLDGSAQINEVADLGLPLLPDNFYDLNFGFCSTLRFFWNPEGVECERIA